MSTEQNNNPISQIAANNEFNFASRGGQIDVVGGASEKVQNAALNLLASSFEHASSIAKQTGLGAAVGGAISVAALGTIDPTALFMGAAAGAFGSISKGR